MKSIFCLTQFLVILFISAISAKTPVNYGIPVISLWEIGFSSGVSIYGTSFNMGSNAIPNRYSYWNRDLDPGIGLFVVRNISPSLGVEINWLNTCLTGKWKHRWTPIPILTGRENPLTFSSQINQFDLMMVFNVNQIMLPGDEEDRGHFFIKTGIGIMAIKDNQRFSLLSGKTGIC